MHLSALADRCLDRPLRIAMVDKVLVLMVVANHLRTSSVLYLGRVVSNIILGWRQMVFNKMMANSLIQCGMAVINTQMANSSLLRCRQVVVKELLASSLLHGEQVTATSLQAKRSLLLPSRLMLLNNMLDNHLLIVRCMALIVLIVRAVVLRIATMIESGSVASHCGTGNAASVST